MPSTKVTSICRKPLPFRTNTQTKALVASGRNLIAFLLVRGDATDIRHKYPRFPRNISADIPRVSQMIEGSIRYFVVVLHPGVLSVFLCLDARVAAVVQVPQTIRDPIDVLLARQNHLAFDAGALRAGDHEQVWKA